MAPKHQCRYCIWCPRQVEGSWEVLREGEWMPVCSACYRARSKQVACTLAEVDTGKRYAFRSKVRATSDRSVGMTKTDSFTLPLFPGVSPDVPGRDRSPEEDCRWRSAKLVKL